MTTFRVWAPRATSLTLSDGTPMTRDGEHWTAEADLVDYGFSVDGGPPRPDPRSPWQPFGVHGLSRVYDHDAFAWTDQDWPGAPLEGAVLYELHVGTFTEEGTFDAAIGMLGHLVDLGVTAVELLPCNSFDGRWGWGYDGVAWFAPYEPYGGPDGLKRFVDACHARGLGVVMDVVHNHFGPSGNYLGELAPYLTEDVHTPWGAAVDLRQPEVRRYLVDNAVMWVRDYHCDGLRLDAVHALMDRSVLAEIAEAVAPAWVVAESDLNDVAEVPGVQGQWADDVHHALHATLTGERDGYYADFGSLGTLAKALTGVFVHDGTWSSFRERPHGAPVPDHVSGSFFVTYLQNHDQVGNRALGDRPPFSPIGTALLLLGPFTPMLFMGEEYAATTPWRFFSDHAGDLGEAVRQGRRKEFASHGWAVDDVPDPQDPATFLVSKLDWKGDERVLAYHRALIALRKARTELRDGRRDRVGVLWDEDARWLTMQRGDVAVCCNLGAERQAVEVRGTPTEVLLASAGGWSFRDGVVEVEPGHVVVVELA